MVIYTRLKVVDDAEIIALSFRPVLGRGLKVDIEKEMGVLRPVENDARTDAQHLFPAVGHGVTVYVGIAGLFEIVSVHPGAEPFFQDFIRAGKIKMKRLTGQAAISGDAIIVEPIGIVVLSVPEIVNAGGELPFGGDEQGCRPVGVE